MRIQKLSFVLTYVEVLLMISCSSQAFRVTLPPNKTVTAILMFGDSIVDTGNNNENFKSPARSNFAPYGLDFPTGEATGRYSNGKVPSDFLVEAYGLKDLLPPYRDPNLRPKDLLTGVCFAVGGVGYDDFTSRLASVPVLGDQLEKLKEYKGKLIDFAGEERAKFIVENSLAFVVLGSNDIANTYYTIPIRRLHYDVPSYADLMVRGANQFIEGLYATGVRRIIIIGAPPIGCVPSQRTAGGGFQRDCFKKENELAKIFNSKIAAEINRIQRSDAKIVYVDIYNPLLDVIQNPTKYGLEIVDKGCCGTGLIEAAWSCNPLQTSCDNRNIYVFWDAYHPSERVYGFLIDEILEKYQYRFV